MRLLIGVIVDGLNRLRFFDAGTLESPAKILTGVNTVPEWATGILIIKEGD